MSSSASSAARRAPVVSRSRGRPISAASSTGLPRSVCSCRDDLEHSPSGWSRPDGLGLWSKCLGQRVSNQMEPRAVPSDRKPRELSGNLPPDALSLDGISGERDGMVGRGGASLVVVLLLTSLAGCKPENKFVGPPPAGITAGIPLQQPAVAY